MLSPGGKWSGLTETLHFQKMRSWDDFSQYLLKPQEVAFLIPMGALNGPALVGWVLSSYTCIFGQEEERHSPLPALPAGASARLWAPDGHCGRQTPQDQRGTFFNALSHTGVNLLTFIRKGFSRCAGLGKLCDRSFCLQPTVKETGKQAQLFRALSMLSGGGFNFIQMCPQF